MEVLKSNWKMILGVVGIFGGGFATGMQFPTVAAAERKQKKVLEGLKKLAEKTAKTPAPTPTPEVANG